MARTTEPVFRREDRGGIFYAWVPDARTGRSVPRSTGKRTEREAVEWRRRYIRRVEDPKGHASRSVTLKDVLEAFLESRAEKRTLASDTIDFYTSKASGTGLGLCLAREAARELGGDLRLLSSTADGTVFVVDLPLASSAGSR